MRLGLSIALCLAAPFGAGAATYTVDTSSDLPLSACMPAVPADCSLRGAIDRANADAVPDVLVFDLPPDDPGLQPATGHWRIDAASALPAIVQPLLVDGFSQPGASANTAESPLPLAHTLKIEVRGPNTGTDGFTAYAPLHVRGLAINRWRRGVFFFNAGPNVVEGCHLGTDVSGQIAVPNANGIVLGGDVRIGGADPAQRNLISANRDYGLTTQLALTQTLIQGNVIGPSADLALVPGRQDFGIYLLDPRVTSIGGSGAGEANLISGHRFSAVSLSASNFQNTPGAPFARIQGNLVGVGRDGRAMGNGQGSLYPQIGISLGGYCRAEIGGLGPGEGNLIAHGANAGVAIGSCWQAPVLGNRFSANRGIAIDLAGSNGFDGPTPNDPGDADASGGDPTIAAGGNRFQNHPELLLPPGFVSGGGGSGVALGYTVDSDPAHSTYPITVYFYRGGCNGGGRELIASDTYGESDAQQVRAFNLVGDGNVLPLTTLAVDAAGNTSEFSPMVGDELFVDGLEDDAATFSPGRCD